MEKLINIPEPRAHLTKAEQRAQASLLMAERLRGNGNIKQLAAKYGLHPQTVVTRLAMARKDGVPDQAREVVIDSLLPAALAALESALVGADAKLRVQVATKIIDGLRVLEGPTQAPDEHTETLEVFRAKLTRKKESELELIDAERIDDPLAVIRANKRAQLQLPFQADMAEGIEATSTERIEDVCVSGEPWDGRDVAPPPALHQAHLGTSSDAPGLSVESATDATAHLEE